jgi:riboflavin synthase
LFTGIVEETGRIETVEHNAQGGSLRVCAELTLQGMKPGDSIAVNGVCLTVTKSAGNCFASQLSPETLKLSTFRQARPGTIVNLERPLTLGGRLGGHMVQGHVDGTGRLVSLTAAGDNVVVTFEFPRELERYLVHKGSIAVDGISLTVASLVGNRFSVAVIPHTLAATNLAHLRPGDLVNLEVDLLAKYFERFFQLGLDFRKETGMTLDYLREQGF